MLTERLKDKVIIVTGGSGLIGKPILKHLNENGAIVLNVDINLETDLEKGNYCCDITSEWLN